VQESRCGKRRWKGEGGCKEIEEVEEVETVESWEMNEVK
jgi:hypothetical protein